MASKPAPPSIAQRLRLALAEAGMSQRQLARELAGDTADDRRIESERRQIGKYLAGQHIPSVPRAAAIAAALGKPADYFVDIDGRPVRLSDQVAEIHTLMNELTELLAERGEPVAEMAPLWTRQIQTRLEALGEAADALLEQQARILAGQDELRERLDLIAHQLPAAADAARRRRGSVER